MDTGKALVFGAMAGAIVYALANNAESAAEEYQDSFDTSEGDNIVTKFVGKFTMGNVDRSLLNHPNIQAFLRVIRRGEGTSDVDGYRRIFGGQLFTGFAWHPGILVVKNGYRSTAAGAYQAIKSTWEETAAAMRLPDFSPASQDLFALGRLAYRGAIADIVNGDLDAALRKTAKEWASLPYSPYGQPTISLATAQNVFTTNGGTVT